MEDHSPKARLLSYLELFLKGQMEVQIFCASIEMVYNVELDKRDLNAFEAIAFKDLFNTTAWYSPLEVEQKTIPPHVGEQEMLAAAQAASLALKLLPNK